MQTVTSASKNKANYETSENGKETRANYRNSEKGNKNRANYEDSDSHKKNRAQYNRTRKANRRVKSAAAKKSQVPCVHIHEVIMICQHTLCDTRYVTQMCYIKEQ